MRHELFAADELEPGQMRVIQVDRVALVVVRTPSGGYHAIRDVCPHYGARLSLGRLKPYVEGDEAGEYRHDPERFVLHCPWHGYEYRLDDGRCPADPARLRVRSYDVTVDGGMLYLER
jgi:nitrite reductase/ring-hydroxylating ferredoxin subunit